MIFGEMKQKLSVLPTPDRHQINEAIHRFVASGGEIQKLDPSPMNRAFDAGDGSGFHLERKLTVSASMLVAYAMKIRLLTKR